MPALLTPGGVRQTPSGAAPWPNWQPNAVTWIRQSDGRAFTPASNPTNSEDTAPKNVTNRQTQDGMLTYIWGTNPELAPLTFVALAEGIAPWKQFRDDFRGQQVTYFNALDNVILPVTITDVRWTASGQNPASWTVYVVQQESEPFS